ncbi:hypothetical protein [Streptomyces sp. NPDC057302]|uniref:hypothetical protein n=1 Tax=Streptomyces sp. NPDC057302 TaxID=3346094 RepID=UPI0036320D28
MIPLVKLTPPRGLEIQPPIELWTAYVKGQEEWTLDTLAAIARLYTQPPPTVRQ